MKLGLPALILAASLPSWLHLPAWAERWLWNARERTGHGITAYQAGRPKDSLRPFDTAARLVPAEPLAQYNAGAAHLAAAEARAAVRFLERAVEAAPAELAPAAHYNLGTARLGAGDAAGAVEALKQSLRLEPQSADAKFNLELALRALEEERQARTPREAPGGRREGERESGEGSGAQEPSPPQPEPRPAEASDPGQGSPQQDSAQESTNPGQRSLPQFREQADMSATQAAAILEAVENLERQQRRAEAARRTRRTPVTERDW